MLHQMHSDRETHKEALQISQEQEMKVQDMEWIQRLRQQKHDTTTSWRSGKRRISVSNDQLQIDFISTQERGIYFQASTAFYTYVVHFMSDARPRKEDKQN